jgi:uncharacterized membrane protein
MGTNRIEAFSDGVIAIILTVMVLELKTPANATVPALKAVAPSFLSYVLSFVIVAIMWVNHHHLMHLTKHATVGLLWSNNFLLFWMSLIPFVTAYMGQTHGAALAVATYGAVLTLAAFGFTVLRYVATRDFHGPANLVQQNERALRKSILSNLLYASSVPLAFISVDLSFLIFLLIPTMYFLPDRIVNS